MQEQVTLFSFSLKFLDFYCCVLQDKLLFSISDFSQFKIVDEIAGQKTSNNLRELLGGPSFWGNSKEQRLASINQEGMAHI